MKPFAILACLLVFSFGLSAQSSPEETMQRIAKELTQKLRGKKPKKVALLRLTDGSGEPSELGAYFADELAFAFLADSPGFAVVSRAELEKKQADHAAKKAAKSASSGSETVADDDEYYEDETYEEESYEEEFAYEEEDYSEEEEYEEEAPVNEKSLAEDPEEKTGTQDAKTKRKKKNTALAVGGALLVAGAVALFSSGKKPLAGVRHTIGGTIRPAGDQLVVTFQIADRKGRIIGMSRGRFPVPE